MCIQWVEIYLDSRYGARELGMAGRGSLVAPEVWKSEVHPARRGTEFHPLASC